MWVCAVPLYGSGDRFDKRGRLKGLFAVVVGVSAVVRTGFRVVDFVQFALGYGARQGGGFLIDCGFIRLGGQVFEQFFVFGGLLHQDGGGGAQFGDVIRRQVEAGRNVQHVVAQLGFRQVVQTQADKRQGDFFAVVCVAVVFVPLVGKGAQAAQGFLGISVDGNVDNRAEDVSETGDGGFGVDVAVDAVAGVDADDDDAADIVVRHPAHQHTAGIDVGHIQQAAHTEVVGQTAVEQVDVGAGFAVVPAVAGNVFLPRFVLLCIPTGHGGLGGIFGRAVVAVAAVVVERNRREYHRYGAGCGDGAGNAQIAQIGTHQVEIFLREVDAFPQAHVGGGNDGKRPFAAFFQVGESGFAEKMGFKLLLQQVAAAEFRRSQAGQVGERENLFGHELLEIQPQEAAVERGNGVLPVQREIGGQHRAARYADDDVYILHQGFFPAADVYLLPVELFQDAVAQGGRPCAAAGKH